MQFAAMLSATGQLSCGEIWIGSNYLSRCAEFFRPIKCRLLLTSKWLFIHTIFQLILSFGCQLYVFLHVPAVHRVQIRGFGTMQHHG